MTRRAKRTSDPGELAEHLANNIREIADYASTIGSEDPERVLISLGRLQNQLDNMRGECAEHAVSIHDARIYGGPPQWDVLGVDEREQQRADDRDM